MSTWKYMQNGQPVGPVETAAIQDLLKNGTLNADTQVWKEGMPNWVAIKTVPELGGQAPVAGGPPAAGGPSPAPLADNEAPDPADVEKNKIFAILAYVGLLFLVPLLAAPQSRFARYHTNQGVVLFLVVIVASIASTILSLIPFAGCLVFPGICIASLVFMVMGIINAANGKCKPLPLIGQYKLIK